VRMKHPYSPEFIALVAGPVSHQDGGGYEPPLRLGLLSLRSPQQVTLLRFEFRRLDAVYR